MSIRRTVCLALASLVTLALVGCAAEPPPPPPPPTIANVTVTASADVNPNSSGRASPVTVTLFFLVSSTAFEEADFFALADAPEGALGQDLASKDQFVLGPGQQKIVNREVRDDVRSVGILASYRDIQSAVWRDVIALPPNKTSNVAAMVEALAVSMSSTVEP